MNKRSEAFAYAYAARALAEKVVALEMRSVVIPDDTSNIQVAVLAAALIGTDVYVKPGVYDMRALTTPVHLPQNVRLYGGSR